LVSMQQNKGGEGEESSLIRYCLPPKQNNELSALFSLYDADYSSGLGLEELKHLLLDIDPDIGDDAKRQLEKHAKIVFQEVTEGVNAGAGLGSIAEGKPEAVEGRVLGLSDFRVCYRQLVAISRGRRTLRIPAGGLARDLHEHPVVYITRFSRKTGVSFDWDKGYWSWNPTFEMSERPDACKGYRVAVVLQAESDVETIKALFRATERGGGASSRQLPASVGAGSPSPEREELHKYTWLDIKRPHPSSHSICENAEALVKSLLLLAPMAEHRETPVSDGPQLAGALVQATWLANLPISPGPPQLHIPGFCARGSREARPWYEERVAPSLHWLCCGARRGAVRVSQRAAIVPSEPGHVGLQQWHAALGRSETLAQLLKKGVRLSPEPYAQKGGSALSSVSVDPGVETRAPSAASAPSAPALAAAAAATWDSSLQEQAEFHLHSNYHLKQAPPSLFHSNLDILFPPQPPAAAASPSPETEFPGATPRRLLITLRCPHGGARSSGGEQVLVSGSAGNKGVTVPGPDVLDGMLRGLSYFLIAGGAGEAEKSPRLSSARQGPVPLALFILELAEIYNRGSISSLERWREVLEAAISEFPSDNIAKQATALLSMATLFKKSQEALGTDKFLDSVSQLWEMRKDDKHSIVTDQVRYLRTSRKNLLGQLDKLENDAENLATLYDLALQERRNYITTVLTVFTAVTWPLNFLTGYFGMVRWCPFSPPLLSLSPSLSQRKCTPPPPTYTHTHTHIQTHNTHACPMQNFQNMNELGAMTGVDSSTSPIPGVPGFQVFWLFFGIFLCLSVSLAFYFRP
jgi:hypothetical protein